MSTKNREYWYFEGTDQNVYFPEGIVNTAQYMEGFYKGFTEAKFFIPVPDDFMDKNADFIMGYYDGKEEYKCHSYSSRRDNLGDRYCSNICWQDIKWFDETEDNYDLRNIHYISDDKRKINSECLRMVQNSDGLDNRNKATILIYELSKFNAQINEIDILREDLGESIIYRDFKKAIQILENIGQLYKKQKDILTGKSKRRLFDIIQTLLCVAYDQKDDEAANRLEVVFENLFIDFSEKPIFIVNPGIYSDERQSYHINRKEPIGRQDDGLPPEIEKKEIITKEQSSTKKVTEKPISVVGTTGKVLPLPQPIEEKPIGAPIKEETPVEGIIDENITPVEIPEDVLPIEVTIDDGLKERAVKNEGTKEEITQEGTSEEETEPEESFTDKRKSLVENSEEVLPGDKAKNDESIETIRKRAITIEKKTSTAVANETEVPIKESIEDEISDIDDEIVQNKGGNALSQGPAEKLVSGMVRDYMDISLPDNEPYIDSYTVDKVENQMGLNLSEPDTVMAKKSGESFENTEHPIINIIPSANPQVDYEDRNINKVDKSITEGSENSAILLLWLIIILIVFVLILSV